MQFVCEFTLENARNDAVLKLQKCKNWGGEDPQTPLFFGNLVLQWKPIEKVLYNN